jgi:predicted heme/steroid binding protein
MKRLKLIIVCFIVLSVFLISCSKKENDSTNVTSENDSSSSPSTQTFTVEELKTYDGQNGNAAYVAIDGIVYDVSDVDAWKDGKHKNGLTAGADLTSKLGDSPHGSKVLDDLPIVGKLE